MGDSKALGLSAATPVADTVGAYVTLRGGTLPTLTRRFDRSEAV
jgi:hypothetical protein